MKLVSANLKSVFYFCRKKALILHNSFLKKCFLLLPLRRFQCFHHRLMAGNESVNANVLMLLLKTPFACPVLATYKTI